MQTSSPPTPEEIARALTAPPVARAVWRAVRDERLRARFATLRASGGTVAEAVERLRGPHVAEDGQAYWLSEEAVRSIVYPRRGRTAGRGPVVGEASRSSGGASGLHAPGVAGTVVGAPGDDQRTA